MNSKIKKIILFCLVMFLTLYVISKIYHFNIYWIVLTTIITTCLCIENYDLNRLPRFLSSCGHVILPIMPANKMIKVVFIVSAMLVMLASILDPLDVINFVFTASLFVASTVSWLLHRLASRLREAYNLSVDIKSMEILRIEIHKLENS